MKKSSERKSASPKTRQRSGKSKVSRAATAVLDDQLEWPWSTLGAHTAESIARTISDKANKTIELTLTQNAKTLASFRHSRGGTVRVRLHKMFLQAPPEVLDAVAQWIRRPRAGAYPELNRFIREHPDSAQRPTKLSPQSISTRGEFYDLRELYDEVNRTWFDSTCTAHITWGRRAPQRARRSIRFGSYTPVDHLIRIHPALDHPAVPRYFVRYIVFHEMLHAVMGVEPASPGKRRNVHCARFRDREQGFDDYDQAIAWMNNPRNLSRVLRG